MSPRGKVPSRRSDAAKFRTPIKRTIEKGKLVKALEPAVCTQPCTMTAFQAWREQTLTPSLNWLISFSPPAGKRFVIELVTAQIQVPAGESTRLRMYTGLPSGPSNLDLYLVPQGTFNGHTIYVATHSLRAYTDGFLEFDVNRDNSTTTGYALICVSGYLVTP